MDGINLKNVPNEAHNPRSTFDLSFQRFFDHRFGQAIPVMMLPVIPDDEFEVDYGFLNRFAPFISQVLQDYKIKFDFYYVPNRVLWNDFDLFMSAGYDGKQTYIHPYIDNRTLFNRSIQENGVVVGGNMEYTVWDFLDLPLDWFSKAGKSDPIKLNALPFAAYLQCFIDHKLGVGTPLNKVRERLMSQEYVVPDGNVTERLLQLYTQINYWQPDFAFVNPTDAVQINLALKPFYDLYPLDYFTSARPDPQLGPVMTIPLQLVSTDNDGTSTFTIVDDQQPMGTTGNASMRVTYTAGQKEVVFTDTNNARKFTVNGSVFQNVATINDFYAAARIQELLTLYGYSGFTPQEKLAAEFGVNNPDSLMHKSKWLHSSIHDINVGEVFSNNANTNETDVPGLGTAVSATNGGDTGFKSYFTEYGFIVGMMTVYPVAAYSQGIPRIFNVADRFDYPHYKLSEIGMASIKYSEIYFDDPTQLNEDFAYTSQYADYKVGINRVNNHLRYNLNYMNAGREFDGPPDFNDKFLQIIDSYNNLNRTFNNVGPFPNDCPLITKLNFNIKAKRQLPYYGLPRF